MDEEITPDDTVDAPERPVSTRTAPAPRSGTRQRSPRAAANATAAANAPTAPANAPTAATAPSAANDPDSTPPASAASVAAEPTAEAPLTERTETPGAEITSAETANTVIMSTEALNMRTAQTEALTTPAVSEESGDVAGRGLTEAADLRASRAASRSRTAEIRPAARREAPASERRANPRPTESRLNDPRLADPRLADPRLTDPRLSDARSDYRGPDPRAGTAEPTVPTNIYRARRPAVAVFLIIPALAIGFLMVRALATSAFGPTLRLDGVIASALGLAALPLLVAGLYGLITGAAHGAEQWGFKVWAKPPLAYLVVGLTFVLTAGIAIR